MNQQTELVTDDWEQARLYAWNDPILDRAAFEHRLQNEPHLADLVAEAVKESLEIHAAFRSTSLAKTTVLSAPASEPHRVSRYLVNTVWALSIAVAVAILVVPSPWNSESTSNATLSSLAKIWSELYDPPSPSNDSEVADSSMDHADEYGEFVISISDDSDGDLPDWLLAATAYQPTDAGAMP
ncbi:MAG: hypothetical protein MUC83_17455 [Pirellula sp.]|jgi:hypothetical protein|nr:hypothetical protein [Pirellula sp.]